MFTTTEEAQASSVLLCAGKTMDWSPARLLPTHANQATAVPREPRIMTDGHRFPLQLIIEWESFPGLSEFASRPV